VPTVAVHLPAPADLLACSTGVGDELAGSGAGSAVAIGVEGRAGAGTTAVDGDHDLSRIPDHLAKAFASFVSYAFFAYCGPL
jgi:hypothetical protein